MDGLVGGGVSGGGGGLGGGAAGRRGNVRVLHVTFVALVLFAAALQRVGGQADTQTHALVGADTRAVRALNGVVRPQVRLPPEVNRVLYVRCGGICGSSSSSLPPRAANKALFARPAPPRPACTQEFAVQDHLGGDVRRVWEIRPHPANSRVRACVPWWSPPVRRYD
jgi:hypothetical protein